MQGAPVKEGEVLAQKYRVDRVLGVGGMGVVVAATHLQLDERVALKFMLPAAFENTEALSRFQREARAAVKLKSEHVARVLDTGTFDNGSPYIVMEYLEGTDLSGELEKKGALPAAVVADYVIQACDALAEAHALGIIHRDLKPANLFVTRRADGSPLVKVLDFGISKANALSESGLGMTKTAAMMGSPLYMSPEQMRSAKDVDPRTDVWSLGIIMYELLGGRVPFNSDTLGGLLSKVMMEQHPPLESIRPDIPRDLSDLVNRCLEKNLDRRARNVADIAIALKPFAPTRTHPLVDRIATMMGMGHASLPPISAAASTHMPASTPMPAQTNPTGVTAPGWGATGASAVPKKSSGAIVALAAVACIAIAGTVGVMKFHSSARPPEAVAAAPTDAPASSSPSSPSVVAAVATAPPSISQALANPPPAVSASPPANTKPSKGTKSSSHTTTAPPTTPAPATKPASPPQTAAAPTPTVTTQKPGIMDTSN